MKEMGYGASFVKNFLGNTPAWYKLSILAFLIINPILFLFVSKTLAGWVLIAEFIYTLALALKCYPLPSGGLLAIEALILGMTSPSTLLHEVEANLSVILLLMFMVAGIYFMKDFLLFIFSRLLVKVKSKLALSLIFSILGAFLSAFLDALTVTAVIIAVAYGFYGIYHRYSSKSGAQGSLSDDSSIPEESKQDLEQFRGFLRNLMMHGAVGTALGGAMTQVGEPQNLIIAAAAGWNFVDFFIHCAHVSIPVFIAGLLTVVLVELTHFLGYGYKLPSNVRKILEADVEENAAKMTKNTKMRYIVQATVGIILIISLALHIAEVGFIGLMVIILLTAFNGVTDEHHFGHAFTEALPFTALLVVFFAIVGVIQDLKLFKPIIDIVLNMQGNDQLVAFFAANGVLSAISDNVFVATVYMSEVKTHFLGAGARSAADISSAIANLDESTRQQYYNIAVAINMGTNIPSVATPNGQAAFLFLLTSSLAPLIRLSYFEMMKLAAPYAVIMTVTGLVATAFL